MAKTANSIKKNVRKTLYISVLCGICLFARALCANAGPISILAPSSSPYLEKIGPAALRFAEPKPPKPQPTNSVLVTVAKKDEGPADADAPDFLAPPTVLPPAEIGGAITNIARSVPVMQSQPAEVVSPQMLLKYFNKSTNGSVTGVTMPVEFAPPQPARPSSSSATFSTIPKQ